MIIFNKIRNFFRAKLIDLIRSELIIDTGVVPTYELINRGLIVGENFSRQPGCIIDKSHSWLILIGNNVTLAPRVHILAHDASTKMHLGYTKIGRVEIGNNVFIGADSIILPNVKIGDNVIIGSGSVVSKDIPDNSVAIGTPARVIYKTDDYIEKNKQLMKFRPIYSTEWTIGKINSLQKEEMNDALEQGIGFVE